MHLKHTKKQTQKLVHAKTTIKLQNLGLVAFYDVRQETNLTEWAYSYNHGARRTNQKKTTLVTTWSTVNCSVE